MAAKKEQVVSKPHGNNPLSDRFDNLPPKEKNRFPRVAYVLQGGGSLGAYQFGVVKGLLEAGYEPDWIAATSIGAIQAAIIVGNPPEKRIERLEQFWQSVAPPSVFDYLGESPATLDIYNKIGAAQALLWGQPHFFSPRWISGTWPVCGDPTVLSYYDTSPLRKTLLELIDFDLLNSCPIRLSLGAVQISTGHLIYFNNINYRIEVDHILASAALPPGFPAINIDGELYWDGGVHSNSPLEGILEAIPAENTLCFLIDCFGGPSYTPQTMNEIEERRKDISYGTHAQRTIYNYLQRQKMRNSMLELKKILTEEQRTQYADLLDIGVPHHCTLVHLMYSSRIVKAASKDYNFGQVIINKRIENGYKDAQAILAEESQWGFLPKDGKSRLYESPNNRSKLLRKLKKV
ncbi:patatin-like phospholipase family protein [Legionella maioricensis]|uniref:Patatin-like phospholipase family protein n=1 Tax=Legionella maioricensis TaxID=2896528 RepID=A0A9X2IBF0_9GAMM|nr:patatin-like phospholipase family protein [Legionella maioricensis]MCL9684874.1 patatin-like phospholipase family protein [Legionella maioricensis]MCL9688950.1 patatin-like phospholipase family protein [Legionella maioricensis]